MMPEDPLERLSRDELIARAKALGAQKPELMTRVELRDEIVRLSEPDEAKRQRARGWLGTARDLVATVVESGLHMRDAAAVIRGDARFDGHIDTTPVATVTLADIYAAQGHRERALELLYEVLEGEPDHEAAQALVERLTSGDRAARKTSTPAAALAAPETPSPTELARPEPATADPAADVPAADVPAADVPAADVPAADVPAADVPAADVPAADVPAADVVTADLEPATDEPATTHAEPTTDMPITETASDEPTSAEPEASAPEASAPVEPPTHLGLAAGRASTPEAASDSSEASDLLVLRRTPESQVDLYWELREATLQKARAWQPEGELVLRLAAIAYTTGEVTRMDRDFPVSHRAGSLTSGDLPEGSVTRAVLGWRWSEGFWPIVVGIELEGGRALLAPGLEPPPDSALGRGRGALDEIARSRQPTSDPTS